MGTYKTEQIFSGLKLLPGANLMNNLMTVAANNFGVYYFNSVAIATTSTIFGTLVSALTGYTFAKYQFKYKKALFLIVLSTLMIPMQLGLVGFLMEMRILRMSDTHWPLILPPIASAFGVYWMRSYISSGVPDELIESGRADGASELRIFFQIVLPITRPALVTIFLYLFLQNWNSYLVPLVVISSDRLFTIPIAISKLSEMFRVDYGSRILALSIATLPIVSMFSFGSKDLIRGLTMGAIKE